MLAITNWPILWRNRITLKPGCPPSAFLQAPVERANLVLQGPVSAKPGNLTPARPLPIAGYGQSALSSGWRHLRRWFGATLTIEWLPDSGKMPHRCRYASLAPYAFAPSSARRRD